MDKSPMFAGPLTDFDFEFQKRVHGKCHVRRFERYLFADLYQGMEESSELADNQEHSKAGHAESLSHPPR